MGWRSYSRAGVERRGLIGSLELLHGRKWRPGREKVLRLENNLPSGTVSLLLEIEKGKKAFAG